MRMRPPSLLLVLATLLLIPTVSITQDYNPSVGQAGKDVIWVPTPEELVEAMLAMAKVNSNDSVMDLGSGDGRIVIAAAKHGARALGIEFNPDMVALSKRNAEKAGVADKAAFEQGDIFKADLSRATVITMYLLSDLNLRLRPTILDLKPGTRVVSHAFTMGEWQADQTVEKEGRTAYLWIVPAKIDGVWESRAGEQTSELTLTQTFQKFSGKLADSELKDTRLEGTHISFTDGVRQYSGQVAGNVIEGTVKEGAKEEKWRAIRK